MSLLDNLENDIKNNNISKKDADLLKEKFEKYEKDSMNLDSKVTG